MATFTGQLISETYKNILNIGTVDGCNQTLPAAPNRVNVTDSADTASSISIGAQNAGICVTGIVETSSSLTTCGCADIGGALASGAATIGGSADVSGNITGTADLSITGNVATTSSKFTVDGTCTCTTNNTCIGGTLGVGGNTAVAGCITATQDIIAFSSSDKRFKDDLNKICNTKDILNGLTGYSFKWNETSGREGNDLGVIAQDVKEVLPEIVQEREDGYLAVDYPKLIPVLIEEVKRLSDEVEKLKSIQTF